MHDAPKTKNALGSVLDREAVAQSAGAHVTLGIVIPSAWAVGGATVTVAAGGLLVLAAIATDMISGLSYSANEPAPIRKLWLDAVRPQRDVQ